MCHFIPCLQYTLGRGVSADVHAAEYPGLFGSAGAGRKRIKQNYDARKRGRRARNLLR